MLSPYPAAVENGKQMNPGDEQRDESGADLPAPSSARLEGFYCAAVTVALEDGFGHVTMEAVARRAGVSKGGLLYHFPNKTRLIEGMLAHYGPAASRDAGSPLSDRGRHLHEIDPMVVALLIAAAEDPSLLAPIAARLGDPQKAGRPKARLAWSVLAACLADRFGRA